MIKDIKDLRLKMQSSTNKVLEQKNDIYSQRKVLLNVEISLQVMQTCHFVLDIFNKVNTQIDQHRYYPALKLLQEIKTHHLDPIASYKLANEIGIEL